MRYQLFAVALAALVGCWLLPQAAEAGALSNLLFTDGETINKLQDVDREGADLGSDTTLDVGDKLFGVYMIDFVEDVDPAVGDDGISSNGDEQHFPTTRTITAVFALEVVAKRTQADGDIAYGFGPIAADATYNSLTKRTAAGASDRTHADTIAMVYIEDFDGSPPPPFDSNPDMDDVGDTSDNALEIWEWGFSTPSYDDDEDNLDVDSLTYFWVANSDTDDFSADRISLDYMASLDVLEKTASGLPLLDHNFKAGTTRDEFVFPDVMTAVQLVGQDDDDTDSSKHLPLPTDTDIWIKPTPEPGSTIALVGLALMGLVGAGWRKRRRLK